MGNWHISIQGTGAHHNSDNPGDVDRLVAEFVEDLKRKGQTVEHATLTYGAKLELAINDFAQKKAF